jgi:hypothetical protein
MAATATVTKRKEPAAPTVTAEIQTADPTNVKFGRKDLTEEEKREEEEHKGEVKTSIVVRISSDAAIASEKLYLHSIHVRGNAPSSDREDGPNLEFLFALDSMATRSMVPNEANAMKAAAAEMKSVDGPPSDADVALLASKLESTIGVTWNRITNRIQDLIEWCQWYQSKFIPTIRVKKLLRSLLGDIEDKDVPAGIRSLNKLKGYDDFNGVLMTASRLRRLYNRYVGTEEKSRVPWTDVVASAFEWSPSVDIRIVQEPGTISGLAYDRDYTYLIYHVPVTLTDLGFAFVPSDPQVVIDTILKPYKDSNDTQGYIDWAIWLTVSDVLDHLSSLSGTITPAMVAEASKSSPAWKELLAIASSIPGAPKAIIKRLSIQMKTALMDAEMFSDVERLDPNILTEMVVSLFGTPSSTIPSPSPLPIVPSGNSVSTQSLPGTPQLRAAIGENKAPLLALGSPIAAGPGSLLVEAAVVDEQRALVRTNTELLSRLNTLSAEASAAKVAAGASEALVNIRNGEIKDLRNEIASLKATIERNEATITRLDAELKAEKQLHRQATEKSEKDATAFIKARDDALELKDRTIAELKLDVKTKETQLVDLKSQADRGIEIKAIADTERKLLQDRIAEKDVTIMGLRAAGPVSATAEVKGLEDEVKRYYALVRSWRDTADARERELKATEEKLRVANDAHGRAISELEAKVRVSEGKVADYIVKLAAANQEASDRKRTGVDYADALASQRALVATNEAKIAELKQQLSDLRQQTPAERMAGLTQLPPAKGAPRPVPSTTPSGGAPSTTPAKRAIAAPKRANGPPPGGGGPPDGGGGGGDRVNEDEDEEEKDEGDSSDDDDDLAPGAEPPPDDAPPPPPRVVGYNDRKIIIKLRKLYRHVLEDEKGYRREYDNTRSVIAWLRLAPTRPTAAPSTVRSVVRGGGRDDGTLSYADLARREKLDEKAREYQDKADAAIAKEKASGEHKKELEIAKAKNRAALQKAKDDLRLELQEDKEGSKAAAEKKKHGRMRESVRQSNRVAREKRTLEQKALEEKEALEERKHQGRLAGYGRRIELAQARAAVPGRGAAAQPDPYAQGQGAIRQPVVAAVVALPQRAGPALPLEEDAMEDEGIEGKFLSRKDLRKDTQKQEHSSVAWMMRRVARHKTPIPSWELERMTTSIDALMESANELEAANLELVNMVQVKREWLLGIVPPGTGVAPLGSPSDQIMELELSNRTQAQFDAEKQELDNQLAQLRFSDETSRQTYKALIDKTYDEHKTIVKNCEHLNIESSFIGNVTKMSATLAMILMSFGGIGSSYASISQLTSAYVKADPAAKKADVLLLTGDTTSTGAPVKWDTFAVDALVKLKEYIVKLQKNISEHKKALFIANSTNAVFIQLLLQMNLGLGASPPELQGLDAQLRTMDPINPTLVVSTIKNRIGQVAPFLSGIYHVDASPYTEDHRLMTLEAQAFLHVMNTDREWGLAVASTMTGKYLSALYLGMAKPFIPNRHVYNALPLSVDWRSGASASAVDLTFMPSGFDLARMIISHFPFLVKQIGDLYMRWVSGTKNLRAATDLQKEIVLSLVQYRGDLNKKGDIINGVGGDRMSFWWTFKDSGLGGLSNAEALNLAPRWAQMTGVCFKPGRPWQESLTPLFGEPGWMALIDRAEAISRQHEEVLTSIAAIRDRQPALPTTR